MSCPISSRAAGRRFSERVRGSRELASSEISLPYVLFRTIPRRVQLPLPQSFVAALRRSAVWAICERLAVLADLLGILGADVQNGSQELLRI